MTQRVHITICGAVQGVGFRPFVYRLAGELSLRGWVLNSQQGVSIEAEGEKSVLDDFLLRLEKERPPRAIIQSLEFSFLDPLGHMTFEIRPSSSDGSPTAFVMPDIATCPQCLTELFDPADRRYRYPFTNCTYCGPRYSIIEALPYDRVNTSMRTFTMCPECRAEYEDPSDRRFHAQPNACPACGPQIELWASDGRPLAHADEALARAVGMIRAGRVIALKGIGGFHLVADARSEAAVRALRHRKHREGKPLAVMFQSLEAVRSECSVDPFEERLLRSPESPIVLLPHDRGHQIAPDVAPGNPFLGALLPYSPIHHLLLGELRFPVVATSGNLSDEPICIDEREALERLRGIADAFLVHNRPIVRHIDDSVARAMLGRELILRRARGYAPLPVLLKEEAEETLAVGAHLKNTVAVSRGKQVFISQHLGDLETAESLHAFRAETENLQRLYSIAPRAVVSDIHPDYLSTSYARASGLPHRTVQHHVAHVASCMAENELAGPLLGVSWDGTGLGTDGMIWGGEFFLTTPGDFHRAATFRPFRLPGGEQAIREGRRSAIGLLYELYGPSLWGESTLAPVGEFSPDEARLLGRMIERGINCPMTTSVGRIFDGVAALLGLRQRNTFEGQAAMELEFAAHRADTDRTYDFEIARAKPPLEASLLVVDWEPLLRSLLTDLKRGCPVESIAATFHNTLARIILEVAERTGEERVVMSGGCFQNAYLTRKAVLLLQSAGFRPYWHQRVPPNDGGISLGQIYASVLLGGLNSQRPPERQDSDIRVSTAHQV